MESIFIENTEPNADDVALFQTEPSAHASECEKVFFAQMRNKVLGEFAPSADLLMSEHDNDDCIFIVRYYFDEFKIGRGLKDKRTKESIYVDSFSEALHADLFGLLERHITLWDWLREIDFKGIDYEGNYALHELKSKTPENTLWPQDMALFKEKSRNYQSYNERVFFETLRYKMEYENAPWPEVLILESDNAEGLYLLRQTYDEFMLGHVLETNNWQRLEQHKMGLADTLNVHLKDFGLLDQDITFGQWLRNYDYQFVKYDHRNDEN
jgi:hypothetical protein